MATKIQLRGDTASNWYLHNPILLERELGLVTDSANQYKIGDGITRWNDLPLRGFGGDVVDVLGMSTTEVPTQFAVTTKLGINQHYTLSPDNQKMEFSVGFQVGEELEFEIDPLDPTLEGAYVKISDGLGNQLAMSDITKGHYSIEYKVTTEISKLVVELILLEDTVTTIGFRIHNSVTLQKYNEDIKTLSDNVAALSTNYTTLSETLATLSANYTTLSETVAALSNQVAQLQDTAIEIPDALDE